MPIELDGGLIEMLKRSGGFAPIIAVEILTGAALTWFADVAVEAAVIEVGLGGRWDATNVVDAPVAVITIRRTRARSFSFVATTSTR